MGPSHGHAEDIEELRERYEVLRTKKITVEAKLKMSKATLENLQKQARERYGTDDLEELRKRLDAMKFENERKRADYQRHLDDIECQLAEVEQQHTEAGRKES
jgi:hypothetical protein